MILDEEMEDCAPFMQNYNCKGECKASDCEKAATTPSWLCSLTNPTDCTKCNCTYGCNA